MLWVEKEEKCICWGGASGKDASLWRCWRVDPGLSGEIISTNLGTPWDPPVSELVLKPLITRWSCEDEAASWLRSIAVLFWYQSHDITTIYICLNMKTLPMFVWNKPLWPLHQDMLLHSTLYFYLIDRWISKTRPESEGGIKLICPSSLQLVKQCWNKSNLCGDRLQPWC